MQFLPSVAVQSLAVTRANDDVLTSESRLKMPSRHQAIIRCDRTEAQYIAYVSHHWRICGGVAFNAVMAVERMSDAIMYLDSR